MARPHNGPKNLTIRRTMIKDTVGHVRKPAYDLPDSKNAQHTYGYEVKRDDEGAGQVLGKWVQANPSKAAVSKRSFIETNRRALASGCVTAKESREYANTQPNIRVKVVKKEQPVYVPPENAIYGIKTQISENIGGLIQAKHTTFSNTEADYPDLSTMHIKGKLPLPRETKASIGKDRRLMANNVEEKPVFKMKKYTKVTSQLSTQPKKHPRHILTTAGEEMEMQNCETAEVEG